MNYAAKSSRNPNYPKPHHEFIIFGGPVSNAVYWLVLKIHLQSRAMSKPATG